MLYFGSTRVEFISGSGISMCDFLNCRTKKNSKDKSKDKEKSKATKREVEEGEEGERGQNKENNRSREDKLEAGVNDKVRVNHCHRGSG